MRVTVATALVLFLCVLSNAAVGDFIIGQSQNNNDFPVWYKKGGITNDGEKALEILKSSDDNGIPSSRYNIDTLSADANSKTEDDAQIKKINNEITQGLILYVVDLQGSVGQSHNNLKKLADDASRKAILQQITMLIRQPDYKATLDSFQASNEQYVKLKKSLATYNKLQSSNLVKTVDVAKPIKPGSSDPAIPQIRQNIKIINAAAKNTDFANIQINPSTIYDDATVTEVAQFQKSTGLETNGIIEKKTIAKLNSYIDDSVVQIKFTMDKMRSETVHNDPKYIVVNLPEFQLYAYNGGKKEFSMPVVVGQLGKETPEFSNHINTVVLNPDWHPTDKISKELVAKMRKNPAFLAKGGYEVKWADGESIDSSAYSQIDWKEVDASDIKIRQSVGPQNALGNIKFLMPNSDDIYLHDTNMRSLFKVAYRALSHGCIRLGDPVKLAEFVLGKELFEQKNVTKKMGHGDSEYIKVADVPVYTTYHTAWVDDNGVTNIATDMYLKSKNFKNAVKNGDSKLNELLAQMLPASPGSDRAAIDVNEVAANINTAAP